MPRRDEFGSSASYDRLRQFPKAIEIYDAFTTLRDHVGYSGIEDVHLHDPEFPLGITCTPSEAELLTVLVQMVRPSAPLEIGSYLGWSAAHMASALDAAVLQCVEPFHMTNAEFGQIPDERAAARFKANLTNAGFWDRIDLIQRPSPDCLADCHPPGGWDFAFVDGWHNHGQPLRDVEKLIPLLTDDAIVVLHDPWVPDVRDAMLWLLLSGFSVVSLNTANFLTICFRREKPKRLERLFNAARQVRHNLEGSRIKRNYLGLCERSVGQFCRSFDVPFRYSICD